MRSATSPSPIVASTKASQMRAVESGSEKPRVVSDDPLISNAFVRARPPVPQKMRVNAITIRIIQTSGRLTERDGRIDLLELVRPRLVPPAMDEQPVDGGDDRLGQAGESLLGQDHRLQRGSEDGERHRGPEDQ